MLTSSNTIEKSFRREYTHGLYKTKAYVSGRVVIDKDTGRFRVDMTKGHDVIGHGHADNLPKMVASIDMKEDMIDYLIKNL